MIDDSNPTGQRGATAAGVIPAIILAIVAAIGWYLYYAELEKNKSFEQDSSSLQQRYQSLSDSAARDGERIAELEAAMQALQDEKSAMQAELETIRKSTAQQQEAVEAERQRASRLLAQLDRAAEERRQLEQSLQQEVQRLSSTSEELEKELQQRLAQQQSLSQEVDAADAEKRQLIDRINQEQYRKQQLEEQIASVTGDVKAKEDALSGARQDLQQLSQELDLTRRQQDELQARIAQLAEQQEKEKQHFEKLRLRLEQELNESRVEITQLKNRMTVINLTSEVLFASGSASIKPAGRKVLSLIAKSLNAYPDRAISIEGHTDNVPIGGGSFYKSNWDLSAARALAAVDFLQTHNAVDPGRLRLVGHGEHRPVADNDTAEGRQLNRRIEIRLLPADGSAG